MTFSPRDEARTDVSIWPERPGRMSAYFPAPVKAHDVMKNDPRRVASELFQRPRAALQIPENPPRVPAAASTPKVAKASTRLNEIEVADRWRVTPSTLQRWRWLKRGPVYLKIGGRVVYRLEDIEAFETAQLRGNDQ